MTTLSYNLFFDLTPTETFCFVLTTTVTHNFDSKPFFIRLTLYFMFAIISCNCDLISHNCDFLMMTLSHNVNFFTISCNCIFSECDYISQL